MDHTRILVVEDENIVALDIRARLRAMGYDVLDIAPSGEQAIHTASEEHPDLVLMDIQLKGEMDGIEAAEQIQTRLDIPVIYLTAYADQDTLQRAKLSEPLGYVIKPFEERDLAVTIEIALSRHKMERRLRESEARYRQLVEHAPAGLYEINLSEGKITEVNDVLCEYTGYTREELLGLSPVQLMSEDSVGRFAERVAKLSAGEEVPEAVEYEIRDKSGREFWVLLNTRHIRAPDGTLTATVVVHDISDRKQAEELVRESEEKYRRVVENANEAIVVIQDGLVKYFNPKALELSGHTAEELNEMPLTELIHPDDLPLTLERYQKRLQGELDDDVYHLRIIGKEGEIGWAELRAVVIDWEDRPATLNFIIDITERRQAEEALRESEARFRSLVQHLSDIIWVVDEEARFLYEAPSSTQILGYEPGFLLGQVWLDFVHPEDLVSVADELSEVFREENTPEPTEFRFWHADGHWVTLEAIGNNLLDHPAIQGIVITARDVSERRRAQRLLQALDQAALRMEHALTPDEIYQALETELKALDISYMILLANEDQSQLSIAHMSHDNSLIRAAERLVGADRHTFTIPIEGVDAYQEVVWGKQTMRVNGEEAMRQALPRLPRALIKRLIRLFNLPQTIAAPLIVQDTVVGVLSIQSDELTENDSPTITAFAHQVAAAWRKAQLMQDLSRSLEELKRTQDQLLQAQKMEAVGRLAGGVAHDFNNLLTVIQVNTQILTRQLHTADPLLESAQQIQEASGRAIKLTRQLLSFSRREAIEPRTIDLNQVIGNLGPMLERMIGEDIELGLGLDRDLWVMRADASQMEQVIINLAVNARDAMPEGGKMQIETANVVLDEPLSLHLSEAQPGEYLELTVSDMGMGISEELQPHIFEPFFTTKERGQGTGLGLPTVFGIVRQNGGHIGISTELGRGTSFCIYFPRVWDVAERQQPPLPEPPARRAPVTGTILVVEDERAVQELTVKILKDEGYQVLAAENGPQAIDQVRTLESKIDLLLTDVIMPEMNGKELANKLRSGHPDLRVLYMSGYGEDVIAHRGALDEGIEFLAKPFSLETLIAKVREVLAPAEG